MTSANTRYPGMTWEVQPATASYDTDMEDFEITAPSPQAQGALLQLLLAAYRQ